MSQNPEKRNEDTKKVAEKNIGEGEPPIQKEDPTQPLEVGGKGSKGKPPNDPRVPL